MGYIEVATHSQRQLKNAFSLVAARDFQTVDGTGMLWCLRPENSLSAPTDDGEVNVRVARREARKRLAKDDRRVNVKLPMHGDVP